MISLTHINEEELRRFYFLEGKISGRDKEINMFNGVQQEYVASRIHDFIIWNDPFNKSKFELYIKENLPKMEIIYKSKFELYIKENPPKMENLPKMEIKYYDIIKVEQIRKDDIIKLEQIRKEQEQKQKQREMPRQRQELNKKKQEQRQNVLQTNTIIINNNYYN